MAVKDFIFYNKPSTSNFVVAEPRPWARENPYLFHEIDFTENFSNPTAIENFFTERFDFIEVKENKEEILLLNLDININF
jgi:hypothetical protein